jgi:hypothetical protein
MVVGDASVAGVENGSLVLSFIVASGREMKNGNVKGKGKGKEKEKVKVKVK